MKMNVSTFRTGILQMVIGATSFWLPDVLIKMRVGNGTVWPLVTLLLPLTCFGIYFLFQRAIHAEISIASWTLAGVYFFGPLFMLAAATLQGGGPHTMYRADYWIIPLDMILPPLTLLLSGYDQSFFALVIVTIGFAII